MQQLCIQPRAFSPAFLPSEQYPGIMLAEDTADFWPFSLMFQVTIYRLELEAYFQARLIHSSTGSELG